MLVCFAGEHKDVALSNSLVVQRMLARFKQLESEYHPRVVAPPALKRRATALRFPSAMLLTALRRVMLLSLSAARRAPAARSAPCC